MSMLLIPGVVDSCFAQFQEENNVRLAISPLPDRENAALPQKKR